MIFTKESLVSALNKIDGIQLLDFIEKSDFSIINVYFNGNSSIDDVIFPLDYFVRIIFPHNYPNTLPTCYEFKQKKIIGYHHLNPDKLSSFCLGTPMDIYQRLFPSYKIADYIQLIAEYLTVYSYYAKYDTMPVTERNHGSLGILEGYRTLFNTMDTLVILKLLRIVPVSNKHKNISCPCGSNLKFKHCHFNSLKKISRHPLLKKQAHRDFKTFIQKG